MVNLDSRRVRRRRRGALDNLRAEPSASSLQASPLAELHRLGNADEVNVHLVAERRDELGVVSLVAILSETQRSAETRWLELDRGGGGRRMVSTRRRTLSFPL